MTETKKKTRPARKPSGKKAAESKTVEVNEDVLRRLQNTILLQNRLHYGKGLGRGVGQAGGSIISGILDPITGLSELFGFVEGLGGGLREGVQTSRLVFIEARTKGRGMSVNKLQAKLDKMKAKQKHGEETFLSEEELAAIEPDLTAALSSLD